MFDETEIDVYAIMTAEEFVAAEKSLWKYFPYNILMCC